MVAFLAVLTPEADAVVGPLRERWDPSELRGLGAHITLRYPFLSLRALSTRDRDLLADAVVSVPSFHYTLARVSNFPSTVFLDPEPASPFAALRTAVDQAFERRLPEDSFPQYAPHLSVARHVRQGRTEVMAALGAALAGSGGAICATCKAVVLLERMGAGPWQVRLDMPLGQPRSI
jgi:2'-5' RNA ligase